MHRQTKIFLLVCFVAFSASFVVQTVFQNELGGQKSIWGGNPGWQREIAAWNVGMAIVVMQALRGGEERAAQAVARGCTVLFLLLGLNHAAAFNHDPAAQFHWPPLILNLLGFSFGVRVWLLRRGGGS